MKLIRITGWKPGLKKIDLNYFIRENCNLGLSDAKSVVDNILQNQPVKLEFSEFGERQRDTLKELQLEFDEL